MHKIPEIEDEKIIVAIIQHGLERFPNCVDNKNFLVYVRIMLWKKQKKFCIMLWKKEVLYHDVREKLRDKCHLCGQQ